MMRWFQKSIAPEMPEGRRVYAVGDVHGRLDLLEKLWGQIEADNAGRPAAAVTLLMLGDLIDRGPNSRGVVERVMRGTSWAETAALMGNHESLMLDVLDGDEAALKAWLQFGGVETLTSWGVPYAIIVSGAPGDIIAAARTAVTPEQRAWISHLPSSLRMGDYYFVHAGIRPDIALDQQTDRDKLWIRNEFLNSNARHEALIVHGHSISEHVDERKNRIGIDTGAYMSGRLTAIGLEMAERWFISTHQP